MKKRIIFIVFLIFTFCYSTVFATNVENSIENENTVQENSLNINADACILYDIDFKTILYEKSAHEIKYPASTTKLLTAIVVLDNYSDLSQMVNVSYYSVHSVPYSYSIAQLQPGESISLKDLLYVMLVGSANDASYVLAQYVAEGGNNYSTGSSVESKNQFTSDIEKFSEMMNNKALEIGCIDSHFVNPNGIHSSDHYSTAYDLALIGAYGYNNSTIREMVINMSYSLNNTAQYTKATRTVNATNLLLYKNKSSYYEYANGLKTGFTDAAGSCIIASANKENRNLIAVVLHSDKEEDLNARENDCKTLFEYGFNNYKFTNVINKDDVIQEYTVLNGTKETKDIKLLCDDTINVLMESGNILDITPEIKIKKKMAPIQEGEVIGTITYEINNETLKANIISSGTVEVSKNFYVTTVFVIIIISLIILLIIGKIIRKAKRRRKRRKKKQYKNLYY